jgi:hypothetical protein
MMKLKPKEKPHYVNNADFSQAVVEYCKTVIEAKETDDQLPIVTDYIASCFLKIAEGLSHKSNFIRYTYREEMVMDAVENCLKAIENYNIEAATRTGKPNAFAYFTQIAWFAFLRRIAKEKKQQDIKQKWISQSMIGDFTELDEEGNGTGTGQYFVDQLKKRIDQIKEKDTSLKDFKKEDKKRKKREIISTDSDLGEILK